jgi:hypothetical protein
MTTLIARLAFVGTLAILLSGCSNASNPADSSVPESASAQPPAPTTEVPVEPSHVNGPAPWSAAPLDGVWEYGDVSYGSPSPIRELSAGPRDEYTFTISTPPTLTTEDGGKTILMSSTVAVTRVHDKGFNEPLSESESYWFDAGSSAELTMSETYGTYTDVTCDNDVLMVGESATCTIGFKAPANEILDSYWRINQLRVGTWPSQVS